MPTLHEALEIAMAQHRAGKLDIAAEMYRQIATQVPQHADAWHLLGVIAQQKGDLPKSLELIDRAIGIQANVAAYYSNRGETLRAMGRLTDAEQSLRRAIELEPNFADAWNNLGLVLQGLGRTQDSIDAFERSLALRPDSPEVLCNRGLMMQKTGEPQRALADFQRALQIRPNYAQGLNNLGGLLQEQGQFTLARQAYEESIRHFPTFADALNNLGLLLMASGHQEEAAAQFRRAVELAPATPSGFSNLCLNEQYRPGATLAGLAAVHREWDELFGIPQRATWRPHTNVRDEHRVIRLGFVSADMYTHPIAALVIKVFERLDRRKFHVVVYSNRAAKDEVTARLLPKIDEWRDIAGKQDAEVAEQIRGDAIDMLFDLSGHTAGHRLTVFARKPAPIQISWMGYVGTTGLTAMDYLFTDVGMVPVGVEQYYSEQIVRLPRGAACYTLPDPLPDIAPPPLLKRGAITYGSFNNQAKITPRVMQTWCEILRRVPESRLILKFRGLDDADAGKYFLGQVANAGVDPRRVELRGPSPIKELLQQYSEIDVALDPFPDTGGTTSMLTLAMGVPVITCPGETVASRQTYSVLKTLDFTDTVTATLDEYVALAVQLAKEPTRLSTWRTLLRERVKSSTFFDIDAWIPTFEATLVELWQRWCRS
ncbi:MAG: tetratricopeptide repeat protein [Planctomycetaceae bacterium]|nr:tetratricopeptide repeat protein [Planctomycetaceae bacterium]